MRRGLILPFMALAVAAALIPLIRSNDVSIDHAPVAWPEEFEGARLQPVALLPVERNFMESFPGVFAAFTDGRSRIVFRQITQPTRKVHPAAGCLRAAGYVVKPIHARRHPQSGLWAAVEARRDDNTLVVREQITDRSGAHSWTDVSAWYWAALFHPGDGPWRATTVITAAPSGAAVK